MTKTLPASEHLHDTSFGGERPLFAKSDLLLENVSFLPGESALKHCRNVTARACDFDGKYPFWHDDGVVIDTARFHPGARAAIWYTNDLEMRDTMVDAPKMFRDSGHIRLTRTDYSDAAECLWNCRDITLRTVTMRGADYVFMHSSDIDIDGFVLDGNYSFQSTRNVTISHARITSKDALWNAENVTVLDSIIEGEYLGWHSRNLILINCTIIGTQPLCYAQDLVMRNCRMVDTDLSFEYATLDAEIVSDIVSIKNPAGGRIVAPSITDIILDQNCRNPGGCTITVGETVEA